MKRYLFFIICIGLLFTSCGTKSEKEIEEETSSGVVLVGQTEIAVHMLN